MMGRAALLGLLAAAPALAAAKAASGRVEPRIAECENVEALSMLQTEMKVHSDIRASATQPALHAGVHPAPGSGRPLDGAEKGPRQTLAWLKQRTGERLRERVRAAQELAGLLQGSVTGQPVVVSDAGSFTARVAAAYFAAISCCTDDVIWLMPFVCYKSHTRRFAAFYLVCMVVTGLISWSLIGGAQRLMKSYPDLPIETVLQIASALLLLYYTVTLYWEWRDARESDAESTTSSQGNAEAALPQAASEPPLQRLAAAAEASVAEKEKLAEPPTPVKRRTFGELFFISILGNLDNFAIYISMMVAHLFGGPELCIGCLLSGMTTVAICSGATQFQFIIDLVECIPMWAILAALSVFAVVEVFV